MRWKSPPSARPTISSASAFRLEQQRALLRPLGARFGEFDDIHWRSLQAILIQQRLLKEPLELSRAVTYDLLHDAYLPSGSLEQ